MFLHLAEVLDYDPPWVEEYETRLKWLAEGDFRIAYVYEEEDTSTFRYRVFNVVEALRSRPDLGTSAAWFTRREFHRDTSFVDAADLVIVCRTRYDDGVARVIERARARGTPVLFDIDDLIFEVEVIPLVLHTFGVDPLREQDWDGWFAGAARLGATLELCDGALTSTAYLAEQIRGFHPGLRTAVVPNLLDRRQAEESDLLFAKKRAFGFARDETITVGYFSGSATHNKDLLVASPGLASAMEAHPEMRLRIVGYLELNSHLWPLADRIEFVPLQDYVNLQRVTAQCEFSIAPLQMNVFTCSKSELKYFEPAAVGCPTIASPTPAFAAAITDGENGYLAQPHEWREKIEQMVADIRSNSDGYLHMMHSAFHDSHLRFDWDTHVERAVGAIRGLADQVGAGERAAPPVAPD